MIGLIRLIEYVRQQMERSSILLPIKNYELSTVKFTASTKYISKKPTFYTERIAINCRRHKSLAALSQFIAGGASGIQEFSTEEGSTHKPAVPPGFPGCQV